MLAAVPALLGYVTIPAEPNATLILRWTQPANFLDSQGLGAGLAFVVERDFCGKMMDLFSEKEWLTCENIDHAMRRAFESWAANHQMISFVNVSDQCWIEDAVQKCEQSYAVTCDQTTGAERVECFRERGNCTKLCSVAEIVVLAEDYFNGRLVDSVAYVRHWETLGATEADSTPVVARGPRLTNGIVSLRDGWIKKATITFMRRECYYLDSTFCASLHETERDFGSVLVLYALFTMPFFAVSLVVLLARFCIACKVMLKHKRGWGLAVRDAIKSIAEPLTEIWLILFLVILMPFLYFGLARPCMRCYDFEAAMAHEVGLALGLAQPNVDGNANYVALASLNSSNCGADAVRLPGEPGSLVAAAPVSGEWTMMNMLLTRQVAPCPTTDDLLGLNMLYPTCDETRQQEPLCFKSYENLGVLRLMVSVGLSVAISFVVAACLSRGSQLYEKAKLRLLALKAETSAAMEVAAVNIQAQFRGHKARRMAVARDVESRRNLLPVNQSQTATNVVAARAQPAQQIETENNQGAPSNVADSSSNLRAAAPQAATPMGKSIHRV